MIEIVDAKQADLDYCMAHPSNDEAKDFAGTKIKGWCKTGIYNGNIMGVGGAVVYWPGVGEGWYLLSEHVDEHKVMAVLCLRKMIEAAMEELDLHRFQATVPVGLDNAKKLLEKTGFKEEGILKMYTQDKRDSYMFAITR